MRVSFPCKSKLRWGLVLSVLAIAPCFAPCFHSWVRQFFLIAGYSPRSRHFSFLATRTLEYNGVLPRGGFKTIEEIVPCLPVISSQISLQASQSCTSHRYKDKITDSHMVKLVKGDCLIINYSTIHFRFSDCLFHFITYNHHSHDCVCVQNSMMIYDVLFLQCIHTIVCIVTKNSNSLNMRYDLNRSEESQIHLLNIWG